MIELLVGTVLLFIIAFFAFGLATLILDIITFKWEFKLSWKESIKCAWAYFTDNFKLD